MLDWLRQIVYDAPDRNHAGVLGPDPKRVHLGRRLSGRGFGLMRAGFYFVVASLSATVSCSSPQRVPASIPDENGGPLSDVILLPLTTRSTDSLLGHAWDAESEIADPLRQVLNGTVVVSGTEQHVVFVREIAAKGELDSTLGLAKSDVWATRVTHVMYDVKITALATFAAGTQRYAPESGCCLQGNPTESCDGGYVYRLMRGSGTIRLLQRLENDAAAQAEESTSIARGGAHYRVTDESTFIDAYFGLELSPLQSVCRTLTAEQEMAPLRQLAPPNCTVHRYGPLGEREVLNRQLPSEELCQGVARRYCAELTDTISCRVRFGTTNEMDLVQAAPTVATPESLPQKPASPVTPTRRAPTHAPSSPAKPAGKQSPPSAGSTP